MTRKRIRRRYMAICMDCLSTGKVGSKTCATCNGTGEIEKYITEIVNE